MTPSTIMWNNQVLQLFEVCMKYCLLLEREISINTITNKIFDYRYLIQESEYGTVLCEFYLYHKLKG